MKKIEKSNSKITKKQKLFYLRNKLKSKKLIPTLSAMALAPLPLLAISANSNPVSKKIVRWSHGIPVVISINDYIKTSDLNNSSDDKYLYKYLSPNKNFHFQTTLYNEIKPKKGVQKFKINFQQVNTSLLKTRDISHDVSSLRNIIDKNDFNINEDIILKVGPNDMNVTNKTIKTYSLQTTSGLKYTADINLSKNSESNWEIKLDVYFNDESRNFLKENDALLKVTVNKALDNEIFADLQSKSSNIIENMEYPTKDSEMHDATLFPKIKSPNTIKEYIGQNAAGGLGDLFALKNTNFPNKNNQVIFSLNDDNGTNISDDNDSDVSWLKNHDSHKGKYLRFIKVAGKTKVNNLIIHGGVAKDPSYDKKFKIAFKEVLPKITKNAKKGTREWANDTFSYATNANRFSINDNLVATLDSNTRYNQVIKKYDLKDSMGKKYSITLKWIRYDYKWWIAADFDFYDKYPNGENDAMLALTISTMNESESKAIKVEKRKLVQFKKESISKINGLLYPPKDDKKHDAALFPKIKTAKDNALRLIDAVKESGKSDSVKKTQIDLVSKAINEYNKSTGTNKILADNKVKAIKKINAIIPPKNDKLHAANLFPAIAKAKSNALKAINGISDYKKIGSVQSDQMYLINKAIVPYNKSTGTDKINVNSFKFEDFHFPLSNPKKLPSEITKINDGINKKGVKYTIIKWDQNDLLGKIFVSARLKMGIYSITTSSTLNGFKVKNPAGVTQIFSINDDKLLDTTADGNLYHYYSQNQKKGSGVSKTIYYDIIPKPWTQKFKINFKEVKPSLASKNGSHDIKWLKGVIAQNQFTKNDNLVAILDSKTKNNQVIKKYTLKDSKGKKYSTELVWVKIDGKWCIQNKFTTIDGNTGGENDAIFTIIVNPVSEAELLTELKKVASDDIMIIIADKSPTKDDKKHDATLFPKIKAAKDNALKLINDVKEIKEFKEFDSVKKAQIKLINTAIEKYNNSTGTDWVNIKTIKSQFVDRFLKNPNDLLFKNATSISADAFKGKTIPDGFAFPPTIKKLEKKALAKTTFAGKFTLPDKIIFEGDDIFRDSTFNSDVTLPNSIKDIKKYIFVGIQWKNGAKLTKLPDSLEVLHGASLEIESKSTTIPLASDFTLANTKIKQINDSKEYDYGVFYKYKLPSNFKLPSTIQYIGLDAFKETDFSQLPNGKLIIPSLDVKINSGSGLNVNNSSLPPGKLAKLKKIAKNDINKLMPTQNNKEHAASLFTILKSTKQAAIAAIEKITDYQKFTSTKNDQIKLINTAIEKYNNSTGTNQILANNKVTAIAAINAINLPAQNNEAHAATLFPAIDQAKSAAIQAIEAVTDHLEVDGVKLAQIAFINAAIDAYDNSTGTNQILADNKAAALVAINAIDLPTQEDKSHDALLFPKIGEAKSAAIQAIEAVTDHLEVDGVQSAQKALINKAIDEYNKSTGTNQILSNNKVTAIAAINAINLPAQNNEAHAATLFPAIDQAKTAAIQAIEAVTDHLEVDGVKLAQIAFINAAIDAYDKSTGTNQILAENKDAALVAINAIDLPTQEDKSHDALLFPKIGEAKSAAINAIEAVTDHFEVDGVQSAQKALINKAIDEYNKSTGTNQILANNKVTAIAAINAINLPAQNNEAHAATLFPAIDQAKTAAIQAIEAVTDHLEVDGVKLAQIAFINAAIDAYDKSTGTNQILAENKDAALVAINAIDLPIQEDKSHDALLFPKIGEAKSAAINAIEAVTDHFEVDGVQSAQKALINKAIDEYNKSTGTNQILANNKVTAIAAINAINLPAQNNEAHAATLFPAIDQAKTAAIQAIEAVTDHLEVDGVKLAQIAFINAAIDAYDKSTGTNQILAENKDAALVAINAIDLPTQEDKSHDALLFPKIGEAKSAAINAIEAVTDHFEVDGVQSAQKALINKAIDEYNKSTGTNQILANNKVTAIAAINAINLPAQNNEAHAATLFPAIDQAKTAAIQAIEAVTDHLEVDGVKLAQIAFINAAIDAYDNSTGTNQILADNKIIALAAINAIDLPTRDDKLHAATLSLAIDKAKLDALKAIEDITDYTKVKGVKSDQIKLINDAINAYDNSTGTNQILADNKESANKEIDEITSPIHNDKLHAAVLFPAIAKAKADALKAIKGISDYQKFDSVKSDHMALIKNAIDEYNKSTGTNQILANNKVTAIAAINAINLPAQNNEAHAATLFPAIDQAKTAAIQAIEAVTDHLEVDGVKLAQIAFINAAIDAYDKSTGTNQILAENKDAALVAINAIDLPTQEDKSHDALLFPKIGEAKSAAINAIEAVTDHLEVDGVQSAQKALINKAIDEYNKSTGTNQILANNKVTAIAAINAINLPAQNNEAHAATLFPAIDQAKTAAIQAIEAVTDHLEVDGVKLAQIAFINAAIDAYDKSTGTNQILAENKDAALVAINAIDLPTQEDKSHDALLFPKIGEAKSAAINAIEAVTDHFEVDGVQSAQKALINKAIDEYNKSTGTNQILANNKVTAIAAINAINLPAQNNEAHAATLFPAIDQAKTAAIQAIEAVTDHLEVDGVKLAQIAFINAAIDAYDKSTGTNQILAENKDAALVAINAIDLPTQEDKSHDALLFPKIGEAKSAAINAIEAVTDHFEVDGVQSAQKALINKAIDEYNKSTGTNQILANNKVTAIAAINAINLPAQNNEAHAATLFPAIDQAKTAAIQAIEAVTDHLEVDGVKLAQIAFINAAIDAYDKSTGTNQILAENKDAALVAINAIDLPTQEDKSHDALLFPKIGEAKSAAINAIEAVTDHFEVDGVQSAQKALINKAIDEYNKSTGTNQILANNKVTAIAAINAINLPAQNNEAHAATLFPAIDQAKTAAIQAIEAVTDHLEVDGVKLAQIAFINAAIDAYDKSTGTNQILAENKDAALVAINAIDLPTQEDKSHDALLFPKIGEAKSAAINAIEAVTDHFEVDGVQSAQKALINKAIDEYNKSTGTNQILANNKVTAIAAINAINLPAQNNEAHAATLFPAIDQAKTAAIQAIEAVTDHLEVDGVKLAQIAFINATIAAYDKSNGTDKILAENKDAALVAINAIDLPTQEDKSHDALLFPKIGEAKSAAINAIEAVTDHFEVDGVQSAQKALINKAIDEYNKSTGTNQILSNNKVTAIAEINNIQSPNKDDKLHSADAFTKISEAKSAAINAIEAVTDHFEVEGVKLAQISFINDAINAYNKSYSGDKILVINRKSAIAEINNIQSPNKDDKLHSADAFTKISEAKSAAIKAIEVVTDHLEFNKVKLAQIKSINDAINAYDNSTGTNQILADSKAAAIAAINAIDLPAQEDKLHDTDLFSEIKVTKNKTIKLIIDVKEIGKVDNLKISQIKLINEAIKSYRDSTGTNKILADNKAAAIAEINTINLPNKDDKLHAISLFTAIKDAKLKAFNVIKDVTDYQEIESDKAAQIKLINKAIDAYNKSNITYNKTSIHEKNKDNQSLFKKNMTLMLIIILGSPLLFAIVIVEVLIIKKHKNKFKKQK